MPIVYVSSVAVTSNDGRLISHFAITASTIDSLARSIAINVDGHVIEKWRRAQIPIGADFIPDAQPSSSP
jgi:hypothetical protein